MMKMYEKRWSFKETRLNIKSDTEEGIKASIKAALRARHNLERFIIRKPGFRNSLEPLSLYEENYSGIVSLMLLASKIARVGPFAAVAGSISQIAAEAGIQQGAENVLIDNGGDIAIIGERDFQVGIYAGRAYSSGKFAFSVDSESLPLGICTSSGSVGHSLSFGDADAVTIVSEEASIADAAATAVANKVKGEDIEKSIKNGLDRADDIREIRGCLILREDQVGIVGKLPKILSLPEGSRAYPRELTTNSFSVVG